MVKVMAIPGIQWAADIMTEQQPIPYARGKSRKSENSDFQSLLDKEMEGLSDDRHDATDRQTRYA